MITNPLFKYLRHLQYLLIVGWLMLAAGLGLAADLQTAAQPGLLAIPPLSAHVVDTAHMLQPAQRAELEQRLLAFEQTHGSQIAILSVVSTQPEGIEQYANRVFEAWKLGRKEHNDGILLLIAAQDRRLRIETGYGLEGAIPDAIAKRIVVEVIAPKFRAGDTYAGLLAGVEQMEKIIAGEQLPPPVQRSGQGSQAASAPAGSGSFSEMLVFGMVVATVIGGILCTLLGRFFGGLVTGGLVGVLAWFMSGSLLVMLASGCLVFLYMLITGGHSGVFLGGLGGGGGGFGGGSWGGGGGGRSGGGGASGGW